MLQPAEEAYTQTSPHAFLRHLTSIEPELLVQPTGWEMEEDELWDDLFDSISQEWSANYGYIMEKTFSFDSWVEDFVSLGFYSTEAFTNKSVSSKFNFKFQFRLSNINT